MDNRAPTRSTSAAGAGSVLRLIRDGDAVTRADLVRRTGLARSTVAQRVDALIESRLGYQAGSGSLTRPAAAGRGVGAPPAFLLSTTTPAPCSSPTSARPTRAWPSRTSGAP